MFWGAGTCPKGVYAPVFHREIPLRLGVLPRRGTNAQIRWFDADPTYVLHWVNAHEDGAMIVPDGFFQDDPQPAVSRTPRTASGFPGSFR